MLLQDEALAYKVIVVPMTPHSMNPCLPCLYNLDYPHITYAHEDLNKWVKLVHMYHESFRFVTKFGASFFNMPFGGKTNLHIAIEHDDADTIEAIISSACSSRILLGVNYYLFQNGSARDVSNLLELSIQQNIETLVEAFLNAFRKQQLPFVYGATSISGSFQSLWKKNRMVLEAFLFDNSLCWEMSKLDVPSGILKNKALLAARVGTLEDLLIHRRGENEDIINNAWKSSNKKILETIVQRVGDTKAKSIIKVFCFENLCKIGSQGILRFLLSQQASAYLFNAPLVKWTILYKWEHIWKKRSLRKLVEFLVALILFSWYVVCIGCLGHKMKSDFTGQVCTTIPLVAVVFFVIAMLHQEMTQLNTYIKDGKQLVPDDDLWGIKHYLASFWNLLELFTYFTLLLLIVPMHILSFHYMWHFRFFRVVLAIESILMCFKVSSRNKSYML